MAHIIEWPAHFGPKNVYKRIKCSKLATHFAEVDRMSRSNNVRRVTCGPYCEEHAREVVENNRRLMASKGD